MRQSLIAKKDFYQKALKIYEEAGDLYNAADEYHQLGWIAMEQQRFEQAKDFHTKALNIFEEAEDSRKAASEYHHLGMIAQRENDLEQAIIYYHTSLKLKEDAGAFYKAASDYECLGDVAQDLGNIEEARDNYLYALSIWLEFNDEYCINTYSIPHLACLYRMAKDEMLLNTVAQIFGVTVQEIKNEFE